MPLPRNLLPALLLPLLVSGLAGCLEDPAASDDATLDALEVYRFVYPGAEKYVPGTAHGWLLRLENPTNHSLAFHVGAYGVEAAQLGPATESGWKTGPAGTGTATGAGTVWGGGVDLAAGTSVAYLVQVDAFTGGDTGLVLTSSSGATRRVPVPVTMDLGGPDVQPGDHVQTVTVGVWLNGTSFYTNSRSLLDDPNFPAGGNIDLAEARQATDPLPVYVYGDDRSEQPAGSRDTCHFTTIDGYNDLLRSQKASSTGVRYLAPQEAYTRPGAEEHFLYGDALVFLNTVVAHDGSTGPADAVPDPTGECFAVEGYLPVQPPLDSRPTFAH